MAEIKNNFLGAKMNLDIDDRLLAPNEYRYALNLEINRSENSDVGTLQNVLGTSLVTNYNTLTGSTGLECIGAYADNSGDNIFIFLTNNTSTASWNKNARSYIYVYNNTNNTNTKLVEGPFLNFQKSFPILGVNLLEDLLFWTDNRNQPRKINVKNAKTTITYYQYEEQISVAKLSPLNPMELYKLSTVSPGNYETSMYDVVSQYLPNGSTANPYYDSTYPGDPAYLEDKYIRFSYRYKFEDGEYSIMAPFTQIAYIPKQDGYFMYEPPLVVGGEPVKDDETSAFRSTIVGFVQNKVNNILLQIKLPVAANTLYSRYKITEIDILYKDANDLSINVVDSIPVSVLSGNSTTTYSYNYQSKKPFKTLPERDLIRVYDKTPVKALGQEVISNRIVYSNYQDKFTYPKYLNYNVGFNEKLPFGFTAGQGTSRIEYPNHSVKQNRNYQVGIVLCDKFGRESGVILSSAIDASSSIEFKASSLYVPYLKYNEVTPSAWAGMSLKILFNETISPTLPNTTTGWPGLYDGDPFSFFYNPLGWYSYKIVVKQTEQEYYNVYVPGTMASYPNDASALTLTEAGKTSHMVLINDNINKVPRDLTEVGPAQLQFRSSVVLYPRVNNNDLVYNNEMYFPNISYAIVSTIATNDSLFYAAGIPTLGLPTSFDNFYQIDSNPLIARLSTPSVLGIPAYLGTTNVVNLAVYETKPIESRLDIYWETSSVGVISVLNTAIEAGSSITIQTLANWTFLLTEANPPETIASGSFYFQDILGATITPSNVTLLSVRNANGTLVPDSFVLEQIGLTNHYQIKTNVGKYFYYGFDSSVLNAWTFEIRVTAGIPSVSKTFLTTGSLTNIAPTITSKPTETILNNPGDTFVWDFAGNNGSNVGGGNSTSDLIWAIQPSEVSSFFTIDSNGYLQATSSSLSGSFDLTITMTEASGLYDTAYVTVYWDPEVSVSFSTETTVTNPDGVPGSYPITGPVHGTIEVKGSVATFYAFVSTYGGDNTTSTTNFTLGNPAIITVGTGFDYSNGDSILLYNGPTTYQVSSIISYDIYTGILQFGSPTKTVGTGSYAVWTVSKGYGDCRVDADVSPSGGPTNYMFATRISPVAGTNNSVVTFALAPGSYVYNIQLTANNGYCLGGIGYTQP